MVEAPSKRRKVENTYISRTVAAKEVCDIIVNQAKIRFSFTTHYSAVLLFDAEKFQEYEQHFPVKLLEDTVNVYTMLEKNHLQTELEIIYRRPDFRNMGGSISLLQFVIENNLQNVFSETYKPMLIVTTIPMTTAEVERCLSTLKRSTMVEGRLNALAMLSIEKNMTANIPNFNTLVIDPFVSKKGKKNELCLSKLYISCLVLSQI